MNQKIVNCALLPVNVGYTMTNAVIEEIANTNTIKIVAMIMVFFRKLSS